MKNQKVPTVLLATGVMNAGGTETFIMECLRKSTGRIRYVLLIHHDGSKIKGVYDDELDKLSIEKYYIESIGKQGIKKYIDSFKKIVSEIGKIDIIHSHLNGIGGIISYAAKKVGIKNRICHCHANIHFSGSFYERLKNELVLFIYKWSIEKYATHRWACSVGAWKRLFMPWRNIVVINNVIDPSKFISSSQKRYNAKKHFGLENKKIIGAVGRVSPIKNYELIINLLVGNDYHFVCFGRYEDNETYFNTLRELSKKLDVIDRVHWMGNSTNINEDIHCFDIFVMPSFTEGFAIAALEAQAAGLPCILSSGIPRSIDIELGSVEFVSPYSKKSWNKAISSMSNRTIIQDNDYILSRFNMHGFDSARSITSIENKYLEIIN